MRLRVKFTKDNYLRYISHIDLIRLFHRAFNRAGIPVRYSEGFTPQPKFSIGAPLSVGISSIDEYMDIEMLEKMDELEFIKEMNKVLPQDIQVLACEYVSERQAIAGLITFGEYEMELILKENINLNDFEKQINHWFNRDKIIVIRYRKHKRRYIEIKENIKEMMEKFEIKEINNKRIIINILMETGSNGNVRPLDLIELLYEELKLDQYIEILNLKRIALYMNDQDGIRCKPIN